MAALVGFEPNISPLWKGGELTNYSTTPYGQPGEILTHESSRSQGERSEQTELQADMELMTGHDPATYRLQGDCSANWATSAK